MNREQFLAKLGKALGGMSAAERREILADYEEHFRSGLAEGRSEEEIARALGNPAALGGSYRVESLTDQSRQGWRPANVIRAVFASLSLGLFNAIIVLGPFIGLLGVLISLWAASGSLAATGAVCMLGAIVGPFLPYLAGVTVWNALFVFFAGVALAALGLLAVLGMIALTRWFTVLVARYVRFNARIIAGRKREE
jgi:uncharacterized membrane protein